MPMYSAQVTDLQDVGPIIDLKLAPTATASAAIQKGGESPPPPQRAAALIDTGASCCVIQENLAKQLKLVPVGQTQVNTPSCQNHPCYIYAVTMILPQPDSGMQIPVRLEMTMLGAPLDGQNIQCLIGRDFLKHAMLVYNGPQDSFQIAL